MTKSSEDLIQLSDYRRRVRDLYAEVIRSGSGGRHTWERYRATREELFRHHPQSALNAEQQKRFKGLPYFEYDPDLRFKICLEGLRGAEVIEVKLEADGLTRLQPFGKVKFEIDGQMQSLTLYWILGYGGGVFLPFRDATAGDMSYGGGRYLLDTIKGADLGREMDEWVIDFNYSYNPSCAYNVRWHCPLAPRENWLDVSICAGEKVFADPI